MSGRMHAALAALAVCAGAAVAQVVSVPITVLVDHPAPDIRPTTVLMNRPPVGERIPTVLFRCDADLDADKDTDSDDLNILLGNFGCVAGPGSPPATCIADINFDGQTDSADLNLLLTAFGMPCR